MTVTSETTQAPPGRTAGSRARWPGGHWFGPRAARAGLLAGLLAVVGFANAWNLQGWPGRVNDDEGTYVAEAWAILYPHHLSHYTYWYDHPPLGWAVIAGWAWLTDGFHRDASAVMVGREVMLLACLLSCALLYVLCRRLGFRRVTAAAAVLLFGLSPLAIFYHRMVFLDNLATMWLLAALAIAASPRRSLDAAFWSAVCFAAAVLSKETAVALAPAVLWLLWQHTGQRTRRWNMSVFVVAFSLLVLMYPLFAALRGELFPGRGHVSLTWSLWWQFLARRSSGSVLDRHSGTFGLAHVWLSLDPWLLLSGVALIPVAFFIRRLRPFSCALLLQVAVMIKGGYLPYAYVTAMLPFAAVLTAGVADTWWKPVAREQHSKARGMLPVMSSYAGRGTVLLAALAFALLVAPQWGTALSQQARVRGDASSLTATAWILNNVPRHDVVVVDDYMWPDLRLHGMRPLWLWKVNTDPQVTREVLPHGYKSIDYIVLAPLRPSTLDMLPTLKAALAHSKLVRTFGDGITAREVIK